MPPGPRSTESKLARTTGRRGDYVSQLQQGHCHELHLDGIRSAAGLPLLHNEAFYTLSNYLLP